MDIKKEGLKKKVARVNNGEESSGPRRGTEKSKKKRKLSLERRDQESQMGSTKKQRHTQPLKGMTLSVSTLKDRIITSNTSVDEGGTADPDDTHGFQEVCQMCRELGAQVTNQVCKRVQFLLCTKSAVEKATQRVRKAFKKKIPIVDLAWLESCRKQGKSVDIGPFLLKDEAKAAVDRREINLMKDTDAPVVGEAVDDVDAGWTKAVSLGCCCVCHENGSEKDCPWCRNGCGR